MKKKKDHRIPMILAAILLLAAAGCGPEAVEPADTVIEDMAVDEAEGTEIRDSDGDTVPDGLDPCPNDPQQWSDADGDHRCDEIDDACPGDGRQWSDADGDGHCDEVDDACPDDANQWTDEDGDGRCDELDDACLDDPLQWSDVDGDTVCDQVDDACPDDGEQWSDADGDGHCDETDDDCPDNPEGWRDTNGDGVCDDNDDTDGDGITDGEEKVYGEDCATSDPHYADTDRDGVNDNEDFYPRDPFPDYILFRNDSGTIDLMLSNRDGTFQDPEEIGAEFGCTADAPGNCGNDAYRYVSFTITDFDSNGRVDFLAYGDRAPDVAGDPLDLWWFWRPGDVTGEPDHFEQRLVDGSLDRGIFGTTADLNNDDRIDLVAAEINRPDYISTAFLYSYENTGLVATATCAYTEDPANPDGCAFIRRLALDITPIAGGQWVTHHSYDAVDVDGDGFRDVVVYTQSSGGNVSVPVYLMTGVGDGTFDFSSTPLFRHNSGGCGNAPANSIMFDDFNNDDVGDIIMGLDDDGDPGSAWFYPGKVESGVFSFDFDNCIEALDINPAEESGSDRPGSTGSAYDFDFNFDGIQDIMIGHYYVNTGSPPSHTILFLGLGTGLFEDPLVVRDFPDTAFGYYFAVPHRICKRYPITSP